MQSPQLHPVPREIFSVHPVSCDSIAASSWPRSLSLITSPKTLPVWCENTATFPFVKKPHSSFSFLLVSSVQLDPLCSPCLNCTALPTQWPALVTCCENSAWFFLFLPNGLRPAPCEHGVNSSCIFWQLNTAVLCNSWRACPAQFSLSLSLNTVNSIPREEQCITEPCPRWTDCVHTIL